MRRRVGARAQTRARAAHIQCVLLLICTLNLGVCVCFVLYDKSKNSSVIWSKGHSPLSQPSESIMGLSCYRDRKDQLWGVYLYITRLFLTVLVTNGGRDIIIYPKCYIYNCNGSQLLTPPFTRAHFNYILDCLWVFPRGSMKSDHNL